MVQLKLLLHMILLHDYVPDSFCTGIIFSVVNESVLTCYLLQTPDR